MKTKINNVKNWWKDPGNITMLVALVLIFSVPAFGV
jgi:predicted negative regulator of RcsB-dependent stress response